jgi:hypothetical protein
MMLRGAGRELDVDWSKKRAAPAFRLGCEVIWALALSMMACFAAPDFSRAAVSSAETPITFDIQPQPLASALDRYGDATGREVFYDAALAAGRRTGGVKGSFTAAAALQMLLEGTGLSARFMADDSFVLLPTSSPNRPPIVPAPPAAHRRYYARIQESLRDAFCRSRAAQPGRYRVVALFWIGPSGDIQRVQRLGSAGTSDIDRGVDETLRKVGLNEPPPAGFMQPVLIMIVPEAPGVTMGCKSSPARLHPVGAERP